MHLICFGPFINRPDSLIFRAAAFCQPGGPAGRSGPRVPVSSRDRSMVQINAGDFRKGAKVVIEGDPYDMLECNFVKPGKGQALYKCRLRNLLKNTIIDRTYKSGDGLEAADVRKGEAQFLYRDKSSLVFMDQESYEQYTIPQEVMGDAVRWLMDGMICQLM